MKTLLYIVVFCSFVVNSNAQIATVANLRNNDIYLCISNPLKVAARGCPSAKVILTTDNGTIKKEEDLGSYSITPEHVGPTHVYIGCQRANKVKTIDSTLFRAKRLPVRPRVAGSAGGEISKAKLCSAVAPRARIEGLTIDGECMIGEFTVSVVRSKKEIFRHKTINKPGLGIDSVTEAFFEKLINNDVVLYDSIKIHDCDKTTLYLEPVKLTITEAANYQKKPKHGEEIITDPITGQQWTRHW